MGQGSQTLFDFMVEYDQAMLESRRLFTIGVVREAKGTMTSQIFRIYSNFVL